MLHCSASNKIKGAGLRALALSALCLTGTGHALAVLGRTLPAASAAAPGMAAAKMNAAVPVAKSSLYTVRNTVLDTGTLVSEYATTDGLVFGLSWQGPTLPDLNALLGSYFSTFREQADASRARRSLGAPLYINTGALVVRSSGRMRNFSGHAYAPDLLPSGMKISDVLP